MHDGIWHEVDKLTSADDATIEPCALCGPDSARSRGIRRASARHFDFLPETMWRWCGITGAVLGVVSTVATIRGQSPRIGKPNLSGAWTLNRDLSGPPSQPGTGANESPRGSARSEPEAVVPRGEFDRVYRGVPGRLPANRAAAPNAIEELIGELKDGSSSLTISHADPVLTVTDAKDRTRLFQTSGQRDPHQIGSATVVSTTRWDGDRLITDYDVGAGRRVRIVYSLMPVTRQLLEQVILPNGQTVKRVYDPARSIKRR
jgi:hypothetical protein